MNSVRPFPENDIWEPRDEKAHNSTIEESLTAQSKTSIADSDIDLSRKEEIDIKWNKINLGGRRGRPRKVPKINYFFEFRGGKKKINIKNQTRKGRAEPLFSLQSNPLNLPLVPFTSPLTLHIEKDQNQLVSQIVEVGEMMGLIDPAEKAQAAELISKSLSS